MTEPERERRPTRFSARPPPRFATGTDFSLWIKRVELYIQEAGLPEEKKGAELVSLLEDEPFRIVSQLGLVSETVEYDAVKACLASHFSPNGVELEWQAKMHVARQKAGESVLEFAGRLRVLADKGYSSCHQRGACRLLVTNLSRVFFPLPSSSNFSQIHQRR